MSAPRVAAVLVASIVVSACGSSAPSKADTVSAAPSTPAAVTGQVDNTAAPLPGVAASAPAGGSKAVPRRPTTGSKTAVTSKSQTGTPVKRTDSIIGYDSIIRFPIRSLPTTSSTPIRE